MIGSKHIGITEEILDQLGSRWTKKEGETRWYVDDVRGKVGTWCKSEFSGVKVWLDAEGAVHVDHYLHETVAKDIVEKIGRLVEAAVPAPVEEAAEVPAEDVEAMTAWAVVEVSAQAKAEAPVEEAEARIVAVFVEREDGHQARIMVPDVGEDVWTCILKAYPRSYDLMDEGRTVVDDGAGYSWDASFVPGEDAELAVWLKEGRGFAVQVSDALRPEDAHGTDIWCEGRFRTLDEAVAKAREEASGRPSNPGRYRKTWVEDADGECVWSSDDEEGCQ